MLVRIELPVGLDGDEPLLLKHVRQLAVDEPDALLELDLLVLGRGLQRPFQVVQHRKQLLDEPLVRTRDQRFLIAGRPLAEVVEVGGDALEVGDGAVPRRLQLLHLLLEVRSDSPRDSPLGDCPFFLLATGHDLASSSTTS